MPKAPAPSKLNPHKLKRLVEQHLEYVKDRSNSDELVIVCEQPGCRDKTGNCSINVKKGAVHCWVCNYSGHVVQLLRAAGVEVEPESLDEIVVSTPIDDLDQELVGDKVIEQVKIELPQGFIPLSDAPDCIYARLIGQMAERKHLYLDDFIEAGVGFTRVGSWEPFAIFPVYELGKLVYYQGRTYAKRFEGHVTKRFPSKQEVPIGASNWVYGYDEAVKTKASTLIVVESILNVLSLRWELKRHGIVGVVPVAVFKHKVSKVQLAKLMATNVPEICFMYDSDATSSAWEEAKNISSYRNVTVATMPPGVDANDDAKVAIERFVARQSYSPVNALDSLLG